MPIDLANLPQPSYNEPFELYMERLKPTAEERPLVAQALAERMAEEAMTAETPRCFGGDGRRIFFMPWTHALVPGHTYSEAGLRETRISNCCEYCFDHMFAETEDEEE